MYQVAFQLDYLPVLATYSTMAAMAVAILVHDRRRNGRFSSASLIGAAVVFGQELLHWPIAHSQAFKAVAGFLASLVYYR